MRPTTVNDLIDFLSQINTPQTFYFNTELTSALKSKLFLSSQCFFLNLPTDCHLATSSYVSGPLPSPVSSCGSHRGNDITWYESRSENVPFRTRLRPGFLGNLPNRTGEKGRTANLVRQA